MKFSIAFIIRRSNTTVLTITPILQNQGLLDSGCHIHATMLRLTCLHEVLDLHTVLENREGGG